MTSHTHGPLGVLALPAQLVLAAISAYLLALLGAAATTRTRRAAPAPAAAGARHAVLVPAHDEQELVGSTVASLRAVDFPADRFVVWVIADNCRDRTAAVAREAGARVLERNEPELRGKGHALAWALSRPEVHAADVVVVVDADCEVSPNFLSAIDHRVAEGARAVQVAYGVANPSAAPAAALRHAAFALVNFVRPLGRTRLGCSAGLLGTGFALTRGVLEREPWDAVTLAEDREYHARLVLAGERVVFAPEAAVRSEMPTTTGAAHGQNLRWEEGRRAVARRFAGPLVRTAWRRRDRAALEAAVDCLVPPQSLLAAINLVALALAVALRAPRAVRLGMCNVAAQALYVIGGLVVARAPRAVFLALLRAPRLAAWKLGLQLRVLARRGPREWVGTRQAPA